MDECVMGERRRMEMREKEGGDPKKGEEGKGKEGGASSAIPVHRTLVRKYCYSCLLLCCIPASGQSLLLAISLLSGGYEL